MSGTPERPAADRYLQALTHASFVNEHGGRDYERLEFLGDAVLQLCVTHLLVELLPEAPPGILTDARQWIVKNTRLARRAEELQLAQGLRMGKGALQQGSATQVKVLADVFEAMLGALYLDVGLEACRDVVDATFGAEIRAARTDLDRIRNPKNVLQEWVQRQHRGRPVRELLVYVDLDRTGPDHDPLFQVGATVDGERLGTGEGTSKTDAQTMAALDALKRLGLR